MSCFNCSVITKININIFTSLRNGAAMTSESVGSWKNIKIHEVSAEARHKQVVLPKKTVAVQEEQEKS